MLVQTLTAFAENKLQKQLHDVAFEERPVPYFLEIDMQGHFVNMVPRFAAVPSKAQARHGKPVPAPKQRALDYSVPRSPVTLTSGAYALLGLGELKYVLGAGQWTEAKNVGRDNERLDAFVERLRHAYDETGDDALAACLRFYESLMELTRAREAFRIAVPGSYVALSVESKVLTDREPVQAWWQQFYETEANGRAEVEGECLITGQVGPIPRTHPQIKYTTNIGGKAGVALMSFNAPAFRSYGWEQNANSPVSANAALKYTMALNDMLRPGSPHRKDDGGVAYLFWLRNDAVELDPAKMLEQAPDAGAIAQVQEVLSAHRKAWIDDNNLFHMVALSANGSRLIVRSSLTELLPVVADNLIAWWKGLLIQPLAANQVLSAPHFWQLKFALDRKGEPSDDRVALLWNRALGGIQRPLGARVLHDVLGRMRVDKSKRLDLAALGLLRLALNDFYETQGKGRLMEAALEEQNSDLGPAYICGRLLALHDSLQYRTFDLANEPQPNSTVADRFYTLVMNSPAIGMATVFNLGRKHVTKLRRLPVRQPKMPKGGASIAFAYEQLIARIQEPLRGDIPPHFGLQEKAEFALGFYHQKAFRPKKQASPDRKPVDGISAEELLVADQPAGDGEQAAPNDNSFFEGMEQ